MKKISLKNLMLRFRWRISFTFLLVIVEAVLGIFYPLLIGFAINDLLKESYEGLINLALLGVASLIVGSARRFYDTRVYSGIYMTIAPEMVENEYEKQSDVSKISARASLLTEFVEFLENSMPEVISSIISLVGILIILATLNFNVFLASLALLILIFLVYALTGNLNFKLNAAYNNQLERQVERIKTHNLPYVETHFKRLMKWNIKLSDLETLNYFFIWGGVIALFIYTPLAVIDTGVVEYGLILSILLYVFDYIEKTIIFPLYIQQLIRLKEISKRLED